MALAVIMMLAMASPVFAANNGNGNGNGNGNSSTSVAATTATPGATIYLKGSGSSFSADGWTNTFDMKDYCGATYEPGATPSVWHLVASPSPDGMVSMQITFTNGKVFNWDPIMDYSYNGGKNNPGWVIIAPYDWKIAYVDSGNNNVSGSFLVATGKVNNFNISGFTQGKQDDPKLQINKIWLDSDGNPMSAPDGVQATFNIYAAADFDFDNGVAYDGVTAVKADVSPGAYQLPFGKFVIVENPVDGFAALNPLQIADLNEYNKSFTFTCTNQQDPQGSIILDKYVDGVSISAWLDDPSNGYSDTEDSINDLIQGFNLYKVDNDGDPIDDLTPIGNANIDASGVLTFAGLDDGWYAVEEVLTEDGAAVFEQAPVQYVQIVKGEQIGAGSDFNPNDTYQIDNETINNSGQVILETTFKSGTVWSFTNGDGHDNQILNIRLLDSSGKSWLSFCGSHGSLNFAPSYIDSTGSLDPQVRANLLKAYNYIISKYGSLDQENDGLGNWSEDTGDAYIRPITAENSTYAIAQIVTWMIVHENGISRYNATTQSMVDDNIVSIRAISNNHGKDLGYRYDGTMTDEQLGLTPGDPDVNAYGVLNDAVDDVLANYAGFTGEQKVTDVAYLTNVTFPDNSGRLQPQFVPIFGGNIFNNTTIKTPPAGALEVTANVTAQKSVPIIKHLNIPTLVSKFDGVNGGVLNNGFTYEAINIDAAKAPGGVDYEIADSNPDNTGIGYYYNVHINEDNQLVVTLDDPIAYADLGFIAFANQSDAIYLKGHPDPNGNYRDFKYSYKVARNSELGKNEKSLTVALPDGCDDVVYLYLHIAHGLYYYSGTSTLTPTAYTGHLSLSITGPDGYTYSNNDFDGSFSLEQAVVGDYTCTLSGDGFDTQTLTGAVVKDATTTVDFGDITVTYH